ncbi:MAG: hypothetical protein ABI867_15800 [Kofleriaceae bacterium]
MAKAVSLTALLFAAVIAAKLVACSPFGGASAFSCTQDNECQGTFDGRCEPNGFCSFPDEACGAGGRSYGDLSGGGLSGTCVGSEPPIDAPPDAPDAPLPEAGETCLGTGLEMPCFSAPPTGAVTLAMAIDTDVSPLCSTMVSNSTACVIAGGTIQIDAGTTVVVTGTKALVLAATTTVTINGTLDVSSKRGVITPGAAANDTTCDNGTAANTSGGGGGGSFGTKGGNGGGPNGATSGNAPAAPATLRGGCKGTDGKDGSVADRHGVGANSGGAVYLIGGTAVSIGTTGVINASGAGATNGVNGDAGGGGGGSGGMIGLDSPAVTNTGLVFANGGGGGEGSGNANAGAPGSDPTGTGAAPGGANGSGNGGDGGNGGAVTAPQNGATGSSGGGGGGSAGIIRVFPLQALGGNVSPTPI